MYNDSIKAENKIISCEDLTQIFSAMGETLKKYQNISKQEEMQNKMLDFFYQTYTFKDEGSKFKVTVDFYDNTRITFDNYESFMSTFYNRLSEIKYMDVYYSLLYSVITPQPNRTTNNYSQSINMYISEKKIEIVFNLKSDDPKLEDVYNLIKNKINNAPNKYDDVIVNKRKITGTIALAIGLIPAMIATLLLLFVPELNIVFFKGIIVYPIVSLFLAAVIGGTIASTKLDKYYRTIVPDKKYAGHDNDYNSVYKDDIDSYVGSSDVLIGKKVDNLENRRMIKYEYDKYKTLLPKELIALGIASTIVIIIGFFI